MVEHAHDIHILCWLVFAAAVMLIGEVVNLHGRVTELKRRLERGKQK